jgi:hypothetical protein
VADWHQLWGNQIIRTIAIAVASYYTAGAASSLYGAEAGAEAAAGFSAAAQEAGFSAGDAFVTDGIQSINAAYAGTMTGSIVGGAASGAAGGFLESNGHLKQAFEGAVSGGISGGISGYFNDADVQMANGGAFPIQRVLAATIGGGISGSIEGTGFISGMRTGFYTSAFAYLNRQMRNSAFELESRTPGNVGTGPGIDGDGYNLAGEGWVMNDDNKTYHFGDGLTGGFQGLLPCGDSFCGTAPTTVFGLSCTGFCYSTLQAFSGPHDWLDRSLLNANGVVQPSVNWGSFGDLANTILPILNIPIAAPFAAGVMADKTSYTSWKSLRQQ